MPRGLFDLVRYAIFVPALLGADVGRRAGRASIQLFTKPFYWEKTEHGLVDAHDYLGVAVIVAPAARDRGADRRAGAERRRSPGPWSGRDRRSRARPAQGRAPPRLRPPRRRADGAAALPRERPGRRARARACWPRAAIVAIALAAVLHDPRPAARVRATSSSSYAAGSFSSAWSMWHAPPASELALGYDEPPLLPLLAAARSRSTPR